MNWEGGKMRLMAISFIIITSLGVWGAGELALAGVFTGKNGFFTGPDKTFNLATCIYGTIGFSTIAYYMYKNSPAQRAKGYPEELGLGEWYLAAYTGLSYLPSADWKFAGNLPPPFINGFWTPFGRFGSVCGKDGQKYRISTRRAGRNKIRTVS